jgi:histidine triad (HIT) family protein
MIVFLRSLFNSLFIVSLILLFIEWRIPGFVSYVFPFYYLVIALFVIGLLIQKYSSMENDCLFCKIVAGEVPARKIYEDERVLAFIDIFPVSKGHTLVVPKIHSQDLAAGSLEDSVALMKAIHDLAPKIVKALGAKGYNLGMNHGTDAGQDILHTHLHIMPRYENDERKFVKTHPTPEELDAVYEQVKKGM